ncbi:MAG: hypothetical protein ACKOWJ_00935 [Micrococcales bacterium]
MISSIDELKRRELWGRMVKNCRCSKPGHHVFYMKHWKDSGLSYSHVELMHITGTLFVIRFSPYLAYYAHNHCPDVINFLLSYGREIEWRGHPTNTGYHAVALWPGGKIWFSFSVSDAQDCGSTPHVCTTHNIYETQLD